MRYLLFLLLFVSACSEDAEQYGTVSNTDTFLQHMAANAGHTDTWKASDSIKDCRTVLYWMLLTSDLTKRNKGYDSAVNITRHSYNIEYASATNDSMLIWINYKTSDTAAIRTLAWMEMDLKNGKMYDVTTRARRPLDVAFDTTQLRAIRCDCIFADNKLDRNDSTAISKRARDLQMIRNRGYSEEPDYGRVF